jgi:hypothetical protein
MWYFILLTLALFLGFARIVVGFEAQAIMSQWAKYRCMPSVMFWASLFKPVGEPRSDMQFTTENFSFCSAEIAKGVMVSALKPVMDVVVKMIETSISSLSYVMNLRSLSSNLFHGLERIFDVFGRRFNLTVHELRKSFLKQFNILQKAEAIATSSVFAGLSMISGIMNAFRLMIIISIVILVILVVLVIFLFYLLSPVMGLIILALSIIGGTAFAGATGGMSDAFTCFAPDTPILMRNGTRKPIHSIVVGDELADGATVTATLKFASTEKLYELDGIVVSGSHIIYKGDSASFVSDSPDAVPTTATPETIYCLNTTTRRISVAGLTGTHIFADWEELDEEDMAAWSATVSKLLNGSGCRTTASDDILNSETGLGPTVKVATPTCEKTAAELVLGDKILDVDGSFTTIVGVGRVHSSEIRSYGKLSYESEGKLSYESDNNSKGNATAISGATWVLDTDGLWKQAALISRWVPLTPPVSSTVVIFTSSGTFQIGDGIWCRDFSDVGLSNIDKTYDFTLSRLREKTTH